MLKFDGKKVFCENKFINRTTLAHGMEDKHFFQCVKTSLKSVVKNEAVIEKLTNAALLTNRIVTHSLQFLKLYLIHCSDAQDALPTINKPFVNAVMKILCEKTENR
eukprot:NODE_3_length_56144_cov_0.348184.p17 type:complete len:106 gc:universal NODE_3_length_56144_cov_0.348184:20984-20667(-)